MLASWLATGQVHVGRVSSVDSRTPVKLPAAESPHHLRRALRRSRPDRSVIPPTLWKALDPFAASCFAILGTQTRNSRSVALDMPSPRSLACEMLMRN
ncbi:hypothetical protein CKAH01_14443 [Colletotrichum kahawae]|uniref:Uncharacterized protein n=1 Tax=Colletotrichum kahawae TaxID=34407 RepID=A0AAD9YKA2_COLKA|nr:hypothetical protein CKAH01_14443 [Colletotrichum kahawae]